jgi:predicted phage terminase large subunit-like protein
MNALDTNMAQLLTTPLAAINKALAERHLAEFQKQMWPAIDPHDYVHGWHIDAICEHMEAVILSELTRLSINIPPRHMKSINVCVGVPAWAWLKHPKLQFLYSSYASALSIRDGVKCRRVIESPLYQANWSDKYKLTSDQNTKIRFDNDQGGYRVCTSVDGMTTGEGGDIIVIDDANNIKEIESDTTRGSTNNWFDEVMQSRFNDPKTGCLVAIQQRTHSMDLSGHIEKRYGDEYCYLVLPARYEVESRRKMALRTFNGWTDPRTEEGELLWKERFGDKELSRLENALGIYAAAGQLQQRPAPRDGGLIPVNKFQRYTRMPPRETWRRITASCDTASKEKELNDPSCIEIWVETDDGVYLLHVWKDKILFPKLLVRTKQILDEWLPHETLVEDKSSGIALAQCLKAETKFATFAINPGAAGKIVRMENEATAIESGMVWIPENDKVIIDSGVNRRPAVWLDEFEEECLLFPNAEHDDQIDPMSMYLKRLRERRQRGAVIVSPVIHTLTSPSYWREEYA